MSGLFLAEQSRIAVILVSAAPDAIEFLLSVVKRQIEVELASASHSDFSMEHHKSQVHMEVCRFATSRPLSQTMLPQIKRLIFMSRIPCSFTIMGLGAINHLTRPHGF